MGIVLYSKAFTTSTGAGGVGVVEVKPFTIQPVCVVESGIYQVQKAFQVRHHFYVVVLKYLVGGLQLIVKVHLVAQARTAATYHTHAQKIGWVVAIAVLLHQLLYSFFCFFAYYYCVVC